MSLKGMAQETLDIIDQGFYRLPSGETVDFTMAQAQAVAHTRLYTPAELDTLLHQQSWVGTQNTQFSVTTEKTQDASRRLVQDEDINDLVVLNFASARNVGGGFLNGAKAQEEDITRSSGLYRCLETQPGYYEANRRQTSLLYTDHIIYTPQVPWFRYGNRDLLPSPYLASVITAPAPNAGQHLRKHPKNKASILETLQRRSAYIFAVAASQEHRSLLLGAWGCGVFQNNPDQVADTFANLLSGPFLGAFSCVVFAIYDRSADQPNFSAFSARFH